MDAVSRADSFDETSPASPLLPRSPILPRKKSQKPWILVALIGAGCVFLVDLGNFMLNPARTRVYEASVCIQYYQDNDPSQVLNGTVLEQLCKINEIQDVVAMIFGWQDLFDAIPGILLAVPYGALADKFGRKWILVLGFIGMEFNILYTLLICYLDLNLKLTWFASAFLTIGGGPTVAISIMFTMLSDVVPPERRTNIFFYVGASILVSEMIAPPISFLLMKYGNWLTYFIGAMISGLATVLIFFIPETLHARNALEFAENQDGDDDLADTASQSSGKGHGHGITDQLRHLGETLSILKKDVSLTMAVSTFLVNRLARSSQDLVVRYASKRYEWSIRQATLLTGLRAGFNLLILIAVLPAINHLLLKKWNLAPQRSDLWIARSSVSMTVFSFFIMAVSYTPFILAFGLVIYTLGSGFSMAMRSVVIFMVGGQTSNDIGRLFAVIAVLEACGMLISGPVIAQFFRWGMKLGTSWLGLPFLVSALMFLPVWIITSCISLKDAAAVPATADEEGESSLRDQSGEYGRRSADQDE